MRRLLALLLLVVSALTVVYAGIAFGQTDPDLNDPDYWLGVFPGAVFCAKHETGDETVHGTITDDGLAVILVEHQPGWAGDRWAGLVDKAGTENAVYELPDAGVRYDAPGGKEVSHWIICKGTTTTTSTTTSTTTTETTVPSSTTSTTDPNPTTTTASTTPTSTTTTVLIPITTTTANPTTSTSVPPTTITTLPYTGMGADLIAGYLFAGLALIGLGILTVKRR